MNIGLERPLNLMADQYRLQLIVDGAIATLYVDGVALNARMYAKPGSAGALRGRRRTQRRMRPWPLA
ncbi:MAG: hypothetical protein R3A10_15505 [Caldilineaceae bacterium]